jgi:hypothetical protein
VTVVQEATEEDSDVQEFTRPQGFFSSPTWCYFAAVLLLVLGGLGFVAAAIRDMDHFMSTMLTLPIGLALGAFYTGYSAGRSPIKVFAGRDGLVLVYTGKERSIRWSDLAWAGKESSGLNQKDYLLLYNAVGKVDVRIAPSFSDFAELVTLIQTRIDAAQPESEVPVRLERNWKRALLNLGVGSGLAVLSIVVLIMGHHELLDEERLTNEGIVGECTVVRHFLAPNGTTKRLEYEVAGENGETGTRDVEVLAYLWESVEEGSTLPVRYVSDAPHISRLLAGEASASTPDTPLIVYGLPAILMVVCPLFIGVGILNLYGIDIDWDPKTGKFTVRRLGVS